MSVELFFKKMIELNLDDNADTIIEYWSSDKKFYYKKVSIRNFKVSEFSHADYRSFFIISKKADYSISRRPYDDEIYPYVIELKGGRETSTEIEKISSRLLAKKPDATINKVYQKLQLHIKNDSKIAKGVNWGSHFYKNIYYDKTLFKVAWGDFGQKNFQILINNKNNKAN